MKFNKLSGPVLKSGFGTLNPECWNDKYADYLHGYARRKLHDEDLIKDLVQDTFLTAYEQLPNFGFRSTEKTWLIGILRIKILLVYRKKANERILFCDELTSSVHSGACLKLNKPLDRAPVAYEDDAFEKKEIGATVLKALSDFPNTWQTVFISKYVEGRKGDEICRSLKLTQTQYWMICHRLRTGLQSRLMKAGFDR